MAAKQPSLATRWADACTEAINALSTLREVQEEYQGWLDNLPESGGSESTREMLETVCDLDIEGACETVEEAEGVDLPRGFGRD